MLGALDGPVVVIVGREAEELGRAALRRGRAGGGPAVGIPATAAAAILPVLLLAALE